MGGLALGLSLLNPRCVVRAGASGQTASYLSLAGIACACTGRKASEVSG